MAAGSPGSVIFGPGRIAVGPTNLSLDFPHGGTELGEVADTYLEITSGTFRIFDEGFGGVSDVIEGVGEEGEVWVLGCLLRTWDNDAIATVFRDTATGASSGDKVIRYDPRGKPGGTLGSARAVSVIFTANHQEHHPSCLLLRAIPLLEETARLALDLVDEHVVPVIFLATPNAAGGAVPGQYGKLEDFALT